MEKNYTTKKISDSTIEITVTIPGDAVKASYETMIKKEMEKTNVKGFRKGKTPRELIESQMKQAILFEVLNRLAPLYLSNAVTKENIELIASPEYKDIPEELSADSDMTFSANLTIMPEFKLGNMKKVKVEVKKEKVTDEEVNKVVTQLEENKNIKAKKGTNKWAQEAAKLVQIDEVENIDQLKEKIKEVLQTEKDNIVQKKAENEALNQAIEICKIEVPDPAVHFEAHEREHSFEHQLQSMNLTMEQYAQSQGVTVEYMVDMWHKDAKEALETDVFLKLYAKEKSIMISDEDLEKEIEKVKQSNNQNPEVYENPEWKEYIRRVVLKQRAYEKFLEEVLPKDKKK